MRSAALFAIPVSHFAPLAMAQSSVTLYGIIDNGVTYATNQGGAHTWQAVSGVVAGSRWGFTGAEDLGGGMKAIFTLENGFDGFSGQESHCRLLSLEAYGYLRDGRLSACCGRRAAGADHGILRIERTQSARHSGRFAPYVLKASKTNRRKTWRHGCHPYCPSTM